MKAIGYFRATDAAHDGALVDLTLGTPEIGEHDLLVRVAAVSVNPVDTKIRRNRQPQHERAEVLGWDAAGTVEAMGASVQGFRLGDRVFYAGAINRPGTNSELHAVDARIVGHAPSTLSDAQAAAVPLTAITAWELLFDRLGVPEGGGAGQTLLVVGSAGGVGSMLIQLARQLTQLKVIGTASRAESQAWALSLGAHAVMDHSQAWLPQLQAAGLESVDLLASLTHTEQHWASLIEVAKPQGRLALIDDPQTPLNVMQLKSKSLSLHWELMFTRSLYQTADMPEQGKLLDRVAQLLDTKALRSAASQTLSPINAANLVQAHRMLESQRTVGKVVLHSF